jgi:hypothetical protein
MSALATTHDQLGWKASAFPISVDGLAGGRAGDEYRSVRHVGILQTGTDRPGGRVAGRPDRVIPRQLFGVRTVSMRYTVALRVWMFPHSTFASLAVYVSPALAW